jgi:hypothetical protein
MVHTPVSDDCIAQLHCCAIRVAKLNADGSPLVDPAASVVSTQFQKITITPVYDAADEIKEKNACGATIIDYLGDPTFVRADFEIDFITPDPYMHAVLLSGGALLEPDSGGVGFAFPPVGPVTGDGVSIEFWTRRVDNGSQSEVFPWAHWALPLCRSMQVGAREFSGTAQHAVISGQCNENVNWADGPFNDFDADSDRVAQWIPALDLPDATCGPVEVAAS